MKKLALVLLMICVATSAMAFKDSSTVVTVTAVEDTITASVGSKVSLEIKFTCDDHWHLYAPGDPVYYGINVAGVDTLPLAVAKVNYPEPHEGTFLGEKVKLYEGENIIEITGVLMSMPEKPMVVELELQACDDKSCLPPSFIPISFTVVK
jgi:hypothetical protein